MVTTLELNKFFTLYHLDLMCSSKYRHLCVLSFDIKCFLIDITIAKLSAAKVRFLKIQRSLLPSKDRKCYTIQNLHVSI